MKSTHIITITMDVEGQELADKLADDAMAYIECYQTDKVVAVCTVEPTEAFVEREGCNENN